MLVFFLVFFFFYNFILSKNKLTLYNSYGFLIFVLLFGFFPDTMSSRNELFLNILVLVYLRRLYSLRSGKDLHKKIFDSGFWLGILFLLAPKTGSFWDIIIFIDLVIPKNKFENSLNSLSRVFSSRDYAMSPIVFGLTKRRNLQHHFFGMLIIILNYLQTALFLYPQ